jgi:pimeloyl-ACP methyl ester carboxylesterase
VQARSDDGSGLYYEVHGDGDEAALCMGGWGTFCHGRAGDVPRELLRRFRVIVFDYRGLGDSEPAVRALTTAALARDSAAILDALAIDRAHVIGLVGLGACVGQELALARQDLVASLFMTGTWARTDAMLRDQLEMFRRIHLELGFAAFQEACAALSFDPTFYEANRDRILGPEGAWSALRDREEAHSGLVDACIAHDTLDRLEEISVPTFVMHAGADVITTPRLTMPLETGIPGARGTLWSEAAHIIAGRAARHQFDILLGEFFDGLRAAT